MCVELVILIINILISLITAAAQSDVREEMKALRLLAVLSLAWPGLVSSDHVISPDLVVETTKVRVIQIFSSVFTEITEIFSFRAK